MSTLQVPGKLFLIGEYGVIEGGHALLAALAPPFLFESDDVKYSGNVHPESPLGLYQSEYRSKMSVKLADLGLGPGFGTSTAELIAYAALKDGADFDSSKLISWYQSHFPSASGADLLVQLKALEQDSGASVFRVSSRVETEPLPSSKLFDQILLFQGPQSQKLPTHEDLAVKRAPLSISLMNEMVLRFEEALSSHTEAGLGILSQFADYLSVHQRETKSAFEIRNELSSVSGVIGVKGCGAGLNDHFIVGVGESSLFALNELYQVSERLQLKSLGSLRAHLW